MGSHTYHTRRQWHNLSVWSISSLIMLLLGVVIGARSGDWRLLFAFGAIAFLGLVFTFLQDRSVNAVYTMETDRLVLIKRKDRLVLKREDMLDASLIDRSAARDYLRQKLRQKMEAGMTEDQAKQRERDFVRFCTVDVGFRTLTFGLGRRIVDTMPNAKHDLILLRLSDGEDLVLSPIYNQDLMERLGKLLRR